MDRGHETDKLHGLCLHQAGVLPVPASTLQVQASNPDTVLGRHGDRLGGSLDRPLVASTPDLLPLSSLLNQLFSTFVPSTLFHQTRICLEPQAQLAPTLGGYTRLLSSTVETINSQERLSTEIWGSKVRIREDPEEESKIHVPSIQSPLHFPHGSHCFGELKTAVQR